MSAITVPAPASPPRAQGPLVRTILDLVLSVPPSSEPRAVDPVARARVIANAAAAKAALAAGGLALPAGPVGWLTVLPELAAVWKLQARMVADIAACFGQQHELTFDGADFEAANGPAAHVSVTREQMLYCLFRHSAAQAVRDLVVRSGERWLVQRASLQGLQSIAGLIGVKLSQQAIGKGVARWMPVIGALGVGAYAYYDCGQVARTAIELFGRDLELAAGPAAAEAVPKLPG